MNILSIDAWRYDHGWTWNQWYKIGSVEKLPDTDRKILAFLRKEGYLSSASAGRVAIDDDGYNVVVIDRKTYKPLIAICYGDEQC